MSAGATGYVVKPVGLDRLLAAVREVHAGGTPLTPPVARLVIAAFHDWQTDRAEVESLTAREREVLERLASGRRYKQIAAELRIALSTVTSHVHSIYDKLHVNSATAAVAKWHRDGLPGTRIEGGL